MDLFTHSNEPDLNAPLAERMRPQSLEDFIGQELISNPQSSLIKNLREHNYLPNLILWGPPGTGKTTLAIILSREMKARFISCNAIDTGAKDLREMGSAAHHHRIQFGEKTLIFIDEIHRLNKAQQDVLLPFTEKGDVVLIGATTENPSYELSSALLSRSQVLIFTSLKNTELAKILNKACAQLGVTVAQIFTPEGADAFIQSFHGDARQLLNSFEIIFHEFSRAEVNGVFPLNSSSLQSINPQSKIRYDKKGDEHYNVISAFIKSVRGSDPDAAIYYLARMLEGGEDPIFIARRLVILASEDIGNADPKALPLAVAGLQAVELIGLPEGRISLAQVTTYLASAPKSNRSYIAINEALEFVRETGALEVPYSLRSAQTKWAKEVGFGKDYLYSHDSEKGYRKQDFLPEKALHKKFYEPSNHGFEKNIQVYLAWLRDEKNKN